MHLAYVWKNFVYELFLHIEETLLFIQTSESITKFLLDLEFIFILTSNHCMMKIVHLFFSTRICIVCHPSLLDSIRDGCSSS